MSQLLSRAITIKRWQNDPVSFFKDVTGNDPFGHQIEILNWCKDLNKTKLIVVGGTGGGKSIIGSTIVPIIDQNGLHMKRIDEITGRHNLMSPGIDKYGNVTIEEITDIWGIPHIGDLLKITTTMGREIICTPDHSMLTFKNNEITSVPSNELVVGNLVPILENIDLPEIIDHVVKPVWNKNKSKRTMKWELTRELGFILGAYLSEGSLVNTSVNIASKSDMFIDELRRCLSSITILTNVQKNISRSPSLRSYGATHSIGSVALVNLLKDAGTKENKRVPPWAFIAPIEFKKGLLSGYFSGDGEFEDRRISAGSCSSKLRDGIALLLNSFGIVSSFRTREVTYNYKGKTTDAKDSYRLEVLRSGLSKFATLFPIFEERKRQKLKEARALETQTDNRLCPVTDTLLQYLYNSDMSMNEKRNHPLRTEVKRGYSGKTTLEKRLASLNYHDYQWIHNDICWVRIKSIERIPFEGNVYDIETRSNTFMINNGLFVHNTYSLAAAALWHSVCIPPITGKPFTTAIAAGGLAQAKRTYEYVMEFCNRSDVLNDWIKGEPLKSEVRFKDNSWVAPIPSSDTQLYNLHCYDEETEVYTINGWKRFTDVDGTESFASLDNGYMIFEKSTGIIRKFYDGPMYNLSTSHLNINVTQDHNLYVRENWYNDKSEKFKLVKAKDVVGKQVEFKKDAKWRGHNNPVVIPQYTSHYASYDKEYKERVLSPELYVKLMAWFLAEGHVTNTQIRITQSREVHPHQCSMIEQMIQDLGYKPSYDGSQFYFSDPQLREYLRQFGTCKSKFVPKEIHDMTPELIQLFLETYEMGGGWTNKSNHTTLTTSSKQMSDDLQILSIKAGWTADVTTIEPKISNGREHLSDVHYRVSIKKRALTPLFNVRYQQDRIYNYKGMVYCVDVPHDLLLVRRKGKVCWSGNSNMFIIDEAAQAGDKVLMHAPRVVGAFKPNRIIISGHFVDDPLCYVSNFVDIWTNDIQYPRDEWTKIHYSSLSNIPWIDESQINMARKIMSADEFKTVWEAELPELTSTLFDVASIRASRLHDMPIPTGKNPIYMAVDWGFGPSPAAILVAEVEVDADNPLDSKYTVLYATEYPQRTGPWMQREIDNVAKRYNVSCIRADSIPGYVPCVIRKNDRVDILPFEDIANFTGVDKEVIPLSGVEILGYGNKFDRIKYISRHPYTGPISRMRTVNSILDATPNHPVAMYRSHNYLSISETEGKLVCCSPNNLPFPRKDRSFSSISRDLAWVLGFFSANGCIADGAVTFSSSDKSLLDRVAGILSDMGMEQSVGDGTYSLRYRRYAMINYLLRHCYSKNGLKKVPEFIFNGSREVVSSFLAGYYDGNGSRGSSWKVVEGYETLLQGILYLKMYVEKPPGEVYHPSFSIGESHGGGAYNLTWNRTANEPNVREVQYVRSLPYNGYVYDVETEGGSFVCGLGFPKVHNSSHSQENYRIKQKGWLVEEIVFRALKSRMQERLRVLLEQRKIAIYMGFETLLKELIAYRLDTKKDDHLCDCLQMLTWQQPKNFVGDYYFARRKYKRGLGVKH